MIRPRAVVVIALAITVFTATSAVLSGLGEAPAAFAASEGFVVSSASAPTIFSSQVEMDMVTALESAPNVTGASPEVFSFATWNDASFVVRGVDIERLNRTGPDFKSLEIVEGTKLNDRMTALVGARLVGRLGIETPFMLPLAGSYAARLELVKVAGVFETGTSLDDELLVSLDVARFLSGMPTDKASIIRVATSEPGWLSGLLSPDVARFVIFDFHASKAEVVPGEPVMASVNVRNWGGSSGTVTVRFFDSGTLLAESNVSLNSSQWSTVSRPFELTQLGVHPLSASISGDFPVTLSGNVTVVDPYLSLSVPSRIVLNSTFQVLVKTHSGRAASGASLSFAGETKETDAGGMASFYAESPGSFTVRAELVGYTPAEAIVTVVDPSTYPQEFRPVVTSFALTPTAIKESGSAKGTIVVENQGALEGTFGIDVTVDLVPYASLEVPVAGMGSATVQVELTGLAVGTHSVQAGTFAHELLVEPWFADNPDLVQLVARYGGSTSLSSAASVPIYQAAKISEGNVAVALTALGGVTALLAALAITSVYCREINESRRRLGVLRTIGASREAVRRIVLPQALEYSLAGACIGIALGVAIAEWLSGTGVFVMFGHRFELSVNSGLLLTVLSGAAAIGVASALASAMVATRRPASAAIRRLEEEQVAPLDVDKLIGDE